MIHEILTEKNSTLLYSEMLMFPFRIVKCNEKFISLIRRKNTTPIRKCVCEDFLFIIWIESNGNISIGNSLILHWYFSKC